MLTEDNKAIVRQYFDEVVNQGRTDLYGEFMTNDVLGHDATDPQPMVGFENAKQVMIGFRQAFPDLRCHLLDILAEGDKVAARWDLHGTHRGPFMGISGSGKTVYVNGIIIYRFDDRKIVEYWGVFDTLALMRQIGAFPP